MNNVENHGSNSERLTLNLRRSKSPCCCAAAQQSLRKAVPKRTSEILREVIQYVSVYFRITSPFWYVRLGIGIKEMVCNSPHLYIVHCSSCWLHRSPPFLLNDYGRVTETLVLHPNAPAFRVCPIQRVSLCVLLTTCLAVFQWGECVASGFS